MTLYNKDYLVLRKIEDREKNQKVKLLVVELKNEKKIIELTDSVKEIVVSDDKSKIAFTQSIQAGLWIYDFTQDKTIQLSENTCYYPSFSSDGSMLSYLEINKEGIVIYSSNIDGSDKIVIYR